MRARTVYLALLHCYPAAFRHEYGHEMLRAFGDQLREARRAGSRLRPATLWIRATLDTLIVAPGEHWHMIRQDLHYAVRTMAARPGFTLVAILSLALGIGANTAIFSLWNGVLRASLPGVRNPGELVMLSDPDTSGSWTGRWTGRTDGPRAWLTYGEFEELRDRARSFSGVIASQSSLATWRVRVASAGWEEARGRLVSGGFFDVLGVRPALGRVFTLEDDRRPTSSIVISHAYWQRRFGGRPDVVGDTVIIRDAALTIIGVTPRGFVGETAGQLPDFWLPLRMQPIVLPDRDRLRDSPPEKVMWLHVFGRLMPGVTSAQAETEANAIFLSGLESFYGDAASGDRRSDFLDQRLRVTPGGRGASPSRTEFSQSLAALLAAVAVLLLIACANLANLLLARGAARRAEIAVRLSLGASRERLVRQLVTESLTLVAVGAVAALGAAYVLHGVLVGMLAQSDARFRMTFSLDPLVLVFLMGVTAVAVLMVGLLPAWHATRTDAIAAVIGQSRGAVGRSGQFRAGRLLVALQLALSLPLLVGAGLLVRTAYNLQHADLGFRTEGLLVARVDLREATDDLARREALRRELLRQFQQIPGVRAASFSQLGLFTGGDSSHTIDVEGYTPKGALDRNSGFDVVGPGYFSALGIPLLVGREILESDRSGAPRVAVVNEAFAKQFFEGRNPLGLHITTSAEDEGLSYQVIGVARNARTRNLRGAIEPRVFVAAGQQPSAVSGPTFMIRTSTATAPALTAIRKTVERADGALPLMSALTLEDQMAPLTAQDRTTAQLVAVFGSVAMLLAAIGLYGVLSYGVARRTSEVAIRIALGAQRSRVVSLILRETLGFVSGGLVAGALLAFWASRLVETQLYDVAPQDPLTVTTATALLLFVSLSAAYLPARRASRLAPIAALRQE